MSVNRRHHLVLILARHVIERRKVAVFFHLIVAVIFSEQISVAAKSDVEWHAKRP